jgi:hypothetical protein
VPNRLLVAALVAASLLALPTAAPAASKKPSLKVDRIELNRFALPRGGTVMRDDGSNGCYSIAGPEGTPLNLSLFGYVTAKNIPKSAPTTVTWTAPWHEPGQILADDAVLTTTWGKALARQRGGPKTAFERYTMAPSQSSSQYVDGRFGMKVSVTVGGKKLTSAVTSTVNCL